MKCLRLNKKVGKTLLVLPLASSQGPCTNTISTCTSLQQTGQAYLPECDMSSPLKTDLHNLQRIPDALQTHCDKSRLRLHRLAPLAIISFKPQIT